MNRFVQLISDLSGSIFVPSRVELPPMPGLSLPTQDSLTEGILCPKEIPGINGRACTLDQVSEAVERSQDFFARSQAPEGYWVGQLEADTSLTSEYLMFLRLIGKVDPLKERKAVRYLLDNQLPDGGWGIYYGGASNISSTVKAYFVLKLSGVSAQEPFMRRACENVLERGGVANTNVFTKIALALFGQYDWRGIPLMPPELVLLPSWFYFNLYEISYWSRAIIIPLLIIYDRKPLCSVSDEEGIDELYRVPKEQISHDFRKDPQWVSWKNFFLTVDTLLKRYERYHLPSLRERAIEKAHVWLLDHMRGSGGLGGIYPAMANSVLALRCLGYPDDHPMILKGIKEIEDLEVDRGDSLYLQPCHSPIWDTGLTINALLDGGFSRDHPSLVQAGQWLLSRQALRSGDWKVKAPQAEPGGWYFQFENEFYPDVDDTIPVLMALAKLTLPDEQSKCRAVARGLRWLLAMQSSDGGWGAFDVDNKKILFNQIPFADHGALLDPSTCDLTGRMLELLGLLGYDASFPPARAALRFIRRHQEPEGCWYGRWGVNYIYGTWSVLCGLSAIGEDLEQPTVRRAVEWLTHKQNADGGWGEPCESYVDRSLAGVGRSTPSQTAWAIIGLLKAGRLEDSSVRRGVDFLLRTQRSDGTWEEREFTGTGFPGVFYLRYHLYSKYFPMWALSQYKTLCTKGRMLSEDIRTLYRLNGRFEF